MDSYDDCDKCGSRCGGMMKPKLDMARRIVRVGAKEMSFSEFLAAGIPPICPALIKPDPKILEDSIRLIIPKLDSMSIKELIELRHMEEGGKNRKTLLKAIDKMRSKFWRKWLEW